MKFEAVITGIGVVYPGTGNLESLWETQVGTGDHIVRISGGLNGSEIDEAEVIRHLSPRLSNKIDSFARYALVATQRALDDAGVVLDREDRERCGAFVGNAFGGWRFTETELRKLHREGPRAVSPFQATAWFPAAPQGQISIFHGLTGCGKTFMADRASSILSVAAAADQIREGKLDIAIAGGTESTRTDFVKTALEQVMRHSGEPGLYAPFSGGEDSFGVGEGAVFLVIEERRHALERGARPYARVGGFAMRNAPCASDLYSDDPMPFMQSMTDAMVGENPDLILPDACGMKSVDYAEAVAIRKIYGYPSLAVPKRKYGHSFGAEGAFDVACAALMLRRQEIVPTPLESPLAPLRPEQFRSETANARLNHVLVNARALGGAHASLALLKGD